MPPFTIWALRSSLVCLVLAWLLELWRHAQPQLLPPLLWAARAAVYHLFFVGWLTQLIFGVAHWMFPTQSRQQPRGIGWLSALTLLLLNLGIALRLLAEPLRGTPHWSPLWGIILVAGGGMQWLAALCFTANIWRRIKVKRPKQKKQADART